MIKRSVVLGVLLGLLAFAGTSVFALIARQSVNQQEIPLPPPSDGSADSRSASSMPVPLAADLSNYNVAYVVSSTDSIVSDLAKPEHLQETLGATIVASWDEFLDLDNTSPVDALIVHNAALDSVDQGWVTKAYRRGIVIALINVSLAELPTLLGENNCAEKLNAEMFETDFFIIKSQLILAEIPAEQELKEDIVWNRCGNDDGVTFSGFVSYSSRSTNNDFVDAEDYEHFKRGLLRNLNDISASKAEYQTELASR